MLWLQMRGYPAGALGVRVPLWQRQGANLRIEGIVMLRLAVVLLAFSLSLSAQAQTTQPSPSATKSAGNKKPSVKDGAAAGLSSQPAPSRGGPCIGVIPLVGDRFSVQDIGLTVFGNEYKEIKVDNWGLDDLVVERVRAAAGPHLATRGILRTNPEVAALEPGLLRLSTQNDEKLAEALRQVVGSVRCQRYVVVFRSTHQWVGNQSVYGIGVVNHGRAIVDNTTLHVLVRIFVHDGETLSVLKSAEGTTGGSNFISGPPQKRLGAAMWPATPEAANNLAMRKAARELLAEVLDKTLPGLLAP
jgi:hypothetical protein